MGSKTKEGLQKEQGFLVAISNELARAQSLLSRAERKLVAFAISKIKEDDEELPEVEVTFKEYYEVTGVEVRDSGYYYNALESALGTLGNKSVWAWDNKNGEDYRRLCRWFDEVEIYPNTTRIRFKFHASTKKYLLNLKSRFTRYQLIWLLAMRSEYAMKLYELICSYRDLDELKRVIYKIPQMSIEELRFMLGVEEHQYQDTYDFIKRTVDRAAREINEMSDLGVSYEKIYHGGKVAAIQLSAHLKSGSDITIQQLKAYGKVNKRAKR